MEGTARELMAEAELVGDTTADNAAGFLRELLAAGPRPAKEIFAEAAHAGYSRDQMHRAKSRAGVNVRKQSMSGGWQWSLAAEDGSTRAEDSEDSVSQRAATFATFENRLLPSGADGVDL